MQGACTIAPRDAEVHFALATCYLAMGRWAEANAEYGVLCQLDTQFATKLYHMMGGR